MYVRCQLVQWRFACQGHVQSCSREQCHVGCVKAQLLAETLVSQSRCESPKDNFELYQRSSLSSASFRFLLCEIAHRRIDCCDSCFNVFGRVSILLRPDQELTLGASIVSQQGLDVVRDSRLLIADLATVTSRSHASQTTKKRSRTPRVLGPLGSASGL